MCQSCHYATACTQTSIGHVCHVGDVGDLPGRPKATQSCRKRPLSAPHSESTHPRFGGPTVAAELTMHHTKELSVCKGTLEVADLCFFLKVCIL